MNDQRSPHGDYARGPDDTERFSVGDAQRPWYLKPWVLALWGLAVVILIAAIVYGLTVLARDNRGGAPAPATTRTTTTTTSPTTSSSTTTPSTTPTTTTSDENNEPAPSPTISGTPQHPHRHRWHGNLPPLPPVPHF